jgi:L-threonylcarbamoyladenylate synthase
VSVPEDISAALARLRDGLLVAFPTETVYGLGADASNPDAIARVFRLKGRPATNPLIVHVSSPDMAQSLVADWPHDARTLASRFWPGPLTIVLPKSPVVPDIVTAGGPTVGVRCPDHHIALTLLDAFGPLVGPSANPSGRVSPTTAAHVRASFPNDEVFTLDGGPCRAGIESTVVSLSENTPRILRPGVISAEQLAAALGRKINPHIPNEIATGAAPAPGLLASHYAPRTPTYLADRPTITRALRATIDPIVAIVISPIETPPPHAAILMPPSADSYAARLYAALREADECVASQILVEETPTTGAVWEAVADRLRRASTPPD